MPEEGGSGGGSWDSLVPATPRPALERSAVVNLEGLENVRLVVATNSNEWGPPRFGWAHGLGIHAIHLDPCSLILLSAFTFLCEAFVGVTPSVALLRHFFSLGLASKIHCSWCASLKIDDASALGIPGVELLPEAEGFRR
ncbi:hypothetical protein D1007_57111 [Hordeum vulgare]|nr:hypothetical protein D1007_57111 [Hordeum vulgare]